MRKWWDTYPPGYRGLRSIIANFSLKGFNLLFRRMSR